MAIVSLLLKLACVSVAISMVLATVTRPTEAAIISCSGVSDSLSPCKPHLTSSGLPQSTPPEKCCAGVRSVKAMAQQTGEHRAVCECMKSAAAEMAGFNYDHAAKLPAQCGVSMSYTFSPKTDCTKIMT
ncbi:unnamed protein product [Amaranthus hypochondriacus]